MRKLAASVLCLFFIGSVALAEDEDKIGITLTSDFYSKYVWRGQLLNDDFVFQPSVTATWKGFAVNAWGNMGLTDYNKGLGYDSGEFTEFDFALSYSGKFSPEGKLIYNVGVIHYQFPSSTLDTTEIFWGLTYDTFLSPTITLYHDIDEAGGATYANFGISHTIEDIIKLDEKIRANLVMGATLGWGSSEYNQLYWGGLNENALNDLALKIALPFSLPGDWVITPSITYVTLVDGRIRSADTYATSEHTGRSDYLISGITISKSF